MRQTNKRNRLLGLTLSMGLMLSMYPGLPVTPVQGAETGQEANATAQTAELTVQAGATSNGVVTISGTHSLGSGQYVTVQVLSPSGQIVYLDQTVSEEGGAYTFTYRHADMQTGTYSVYVNGAGSSERQLASFTFQATSGPVVPTNPPGQTDGGSADPESDDLATELEAGTGKAKASVSRDGLEKLFDKVQSDARGKKKIKLKLQPVPGAKRYELELPASEFVAGSRDRMVEIQTEFGAVTLPGNLLTAEQVSGSDTFAFSIEPVDSSARSERMKDNQALIGERPVVDLTFLINGKDAKWHNRDTTVQVAIPYTPGENEQGLAEFLMIWYVAEDGQMVPVSSGHYDANEQMMRFQTDHFSTYAVGFQPKSFGDLNEAVWAKHAIEVMAAKGIVNGVSETSYQPMKEVKRADFLLLLMQTLGLNMTYTDQFADVDRSAYYADAVGAAKKLGIVHGTGSGLFHPQQQISRQDMMVMINQAMAVAGHLSSEGDRQALDAFKDVDQIAAYALDSVSVLVKEGIVSGSNGRILPKGQATRAEAAMLMYQIYQRIYTN
ncbi:S-layer homology domain-containing protein [Marinicrinis sediminis]|uniref:S-layer homology domain-containing protein n=1 Tax=Marinicrinis sediminis TaxID=1652465 RepID=A0ABW5RFS8_9BACL